MRRRVVLVVDDDAEMRQLLCEILPSDLGVRVVAARSGDQALGRLRDEVVDLVLLDIRMHLMNGLEVIRRMRGDPAWRPIPVVILTAAGLGAIGEAMALGADGWIEKPFEVDELTSRLALWLGQAGPAAHIAAGAELA